MDKHPPVLEGGKVEAVRELDVQPYNFRARKRLGDKVFAGTRVFRTNVWQLQVGCCK